MHLSCLRSAIPALAVLALCAPVAPVAADALPESVRIVIDQSYEYRPASTITYRPIEGMDLPVADLVEDLFFAAGIDTLLQDDAGEADAVIRVLVQGRANGGGYFEPVKAYLYTGARITGEVVIERPGQAPVITSFVSETQRPFRLAFNLGYEDPANAPFDTTLLQPGGFVRQLASAVAQVWGVEAIAPALFEPDPALRYNVASLLGDIGDAAVVPDLIEALDDEHERVRWEAAWSLGRIGDPVAIGPLIVTLSDQAEDVRWFASWSLRTITGQPFGADRAEWEAWAAEQRPAPGT
jgi:hypothetical protein